MAIYPDHAPIGKRSFAMAVDCLAAFALYWIVVEANLPLAEEQFLALAATCFVVAVTASTRIFPGQSPGKSITRLQVLAADAGELTPGRHIIRDSSYPLIAFLLSSGFTTTGIQGLEEGFAIALAFVAMAERVCVSVRSDSRSIADLVFRTRVVCLPPLQPHRAPAGPMYSATDVEFGKFGQAPKRDA